VCIVTEQWSALQRKGAVFAGVIAVTAFLFHTSLDVRYTVCMFGALGYFDTFPVIRTNCVKCIAKTSEQMLT
jgi:hypothetical protein